MIVDLIPELLPVINIREIWDELAEIDWLRRHKTL